MFKLYGSGYGGTETPPAANNTRTRPTTMQGHMGTGALWPRVKGRREHREVGAKECEGPFNTACVFVHVCFYGDKSFFMLIYRLRKESVACIPSHHHTVHSGTDLNSCHLCAQARTKRGRRQSRTPRFKQRPGEQTVFSVGRLGLSVNMSGQVLAGLPENSFVILFSIQVPSDTS